MTDINAIKEKIRKLKAMTPEQGCTEAEAATAAAAAMRLMAEHDLSDSDIAFGEVTLPTFQRRRHQADMIWLTVAKVCRCASTLRLGTARLSITYHGRLADVQVAEYLHQVALGALNRASEEFRGSPMYRRRRTARTRSQALRTYLLGVAIGLDRALTDAWWLGLRDSAELQKAHKDAMGAALAVRDQALATRPMRPLSARKHDKGLLGLGAQHGRGVSINPAAAGSNDQLKMIGGGK